VPSSHAKHDKFNRRIEISATITEAIADALEHAKDLPEEVSNVAQRDIAGDSNPRPSGYEADDGVIGRPPWFVTSVPMRENPNSPLPRVPRLTGSAGRGLERDQCHHVTQGACACLQLCHCCPRVR
jgi:hypothetical protein